MATPLMPADELVLLRFRNRGTRSVSESEKWSGKTSIRRVPPSNRYSPRSGFRQIHGTSSREGSAIPIAISGGDERRISPRGGRAAGTTKNRIPPVRGGRAGGAPGEARARPA